MQKTDNENIRRKYVETIRVFENAKTLSGTLWLMYLNHLEKSEKEQKQQRKNVFSMMFPTHVLFFQHTYIAYFQPSVHI